MIRLFSIAAVSVAFVLLTREARTEPIFVDAWTPDLQGVLDAAAPGAIIELGQGVFAGPIRIEKPLILRGRGGVIDGGHEGTPLVIAAPGVRVEGIAVRNSGEDVGRAEALRKSTVRSDMIPSKPRSVA